METTTAPAIAWKRLGAGHYRSHSAGHRFEIARSDARVGGWWNLTRNGVPAQAANGMSSFDTLRSAQAAAEAILDEL